MTKTLAQMTAEVRDVNTEKGWRAGDNTVGDYIALLHSELSEALEAFRDHRLADATAGYNHELERPGKPEGAGSEFADVLIRLLDMCDVLNVELFDMDMELGDVAPVDLNAADVPRDLVTFGDHVTWLHDCASRMWRTPRGAGSVLRALVTVAEKYELNLQAEYERKVEYNRTRAYQHGGRTLSEVGRVTR